MKDFLRKIISIIYDLFLLLRVTVTLRIGKSKVNNDQRSMKIPDQEEDSGGKDCYDK